jgi:hypothetical protein
MAYGIDPQLPLQASDPLVQSQRAFNLGQSQLEAGRNTQQYNQDQQKQRALKEIFQRADTSSPEGQADLVRQVGRVDPNAAIQLQGNFQKQALEKEQLKTEQGKQKEQESLAGLHTQQIQDSRREAFANGMGELLRVGNTIQSQYESDVKSGMLPIQAQEKAVKSLTEEKDSLAARYKDNPDMMKILEIQPKSYNPEAAKQGLQKIAAMVGQLNQQKAPPGYQPSPQGGLQPIQGGPADPNQIRAEHQARETTPEEAARIETARERAKLAVTRESSALDRTSPGFQARAAEIAKGVPISQVVKGWGTGSKEEARALQDEAVTQIMQENPSISPKRAGEILADRANEYKGQGAGERTLGTRGANLSIAAAELDKFVPIAQQASDKVPRASFVPLNKLTRTARNQWSPEQAAFEAANRSVLNAFSQVASRGVPTVHNTEEAEKMLYTAQTPEQYKAVLAQLQREAKGALAAIPEAREAMKSSREGNEPTTGVKKYDPSTGTFH